MKLYEDIQKRTGGNIYVGVTGPVRVGKSSFVKRLMEELVIPNISDDYRRERAMDELPQSGSGKTIMTAEPKFVPEEAVEISPDGKTTLSVRLIDSVGYMISGALGATEDGKPRMVTTPWFEHEIPMTEAAELGTKKVMENHCTVGIVVTTDGSVTDIPREDYLQAEHRAITDMIATGKPFVVLLNAEQPESEQAQRVAERIRTDYEVKCRPVNVLTMNRNEINEILSDLLNEFSTEELRFYLPAWFDALEYSHSLKQTIYAAVHAAAEKVRKLSQVEALCGELLEQNTVNECELAKIDPGTGTINYRIRLQEQLFYEILSERSGVDVRDDGDLLGVLSDYRAIRSEYERLDSALTQVRTTGYGIVMPVKDEVELKMPELIKKGSAYGVRLRASAPSIHMMRADISAELSPMVGDEQQTGDLVRSLVSAYEGEGDELWQSNIFGKTLYDLVNESLNAKISRLQEDSRMKVKNALTKIVNEGANGLICLVL